jgi:hypothetical protein
MTESRDPRSIIENAEKAAAAGNYAAAENLLRDAAALQEQTLGPNHPDLANTFNNLGIVCEMTDNPIDAEHYFRRAYSIATSALAPDHPFLATSRKNLHDFCTARGRPLELPPSPPALAAWLDAPAPPVNEPQEEPASTPAPVSLPPPQDVASPAQSRSWRPLALVALTGAVILMAFVTMARWDRKGEEPTQTAAAIAPTVDTPVAAGAPDPAPASPTAPPPAALPEPEPAPPTASIATPPPREAGSPTVVTAQLCTALVSWQCKTASGDVASGPVFFYTQVKSARATTIEHRWYRGDRLRRTVALRVDANPGAGYRTYSRSTISRENAGEWRVELRSADGTVLHEERFTVR